jgi:hypothetical protein
MLFLHRLHRGESNPINQINTTKINTTKINKTLTHAVGAAGRAASVMGITVRHDRFDCVSVCVLVCSSNHLQIIFLGKLFSKLFSLDIRQVNPVRRVQQGQQGGHHFLHFDISRVALYVL